jgi:hypothetical protein
LLDVVKVIVTDAEVPVTVTLPVTGFAVYPVTEPTEYAYVPFISENATVVLVEDSGLPAKVTDHEVPAASPLSVNVTEYWPAASAVNVIATDCEVPATVTDPDEGLAVYPATDPTV